MGNNIKTKHNFNDGVFRHLFKETKNFIEMYEVFTGVKLSPDEIEFRNTDSIVLSKDLKNDVSFITKDGRFIVLVEHQSTRSPNILLRMLIYYAELLKMYIKKHDLNVYGTIPIKYPKAEFYVAYNGKKPWLMDEMFTAGDVMINVKLVDINFMNLPIKDSGNTLSGYAYLVQQFDYYKKVKNLSSQIAVDKALTDCELHGYLVDYTGREEFLSMVTKRWTVEQQMEDYKTWAREEGEFNKAIEIAKNMLNDGLPAETVVKYSGLDIEKIHDLDV